MDLHLAGRRALITGGSKGIGRAVAEALAGEGVDVILVARDAAVLAEAAQVVRARRQVNVATIPADLSREDEVVRVAREAGEIDILVNNAGAIPPGTLAAVDNDTWRRAWDLKVFGFISLCRAVYPAMAARGSGVIVNVIGAAGEKLPANYIAGSAGNAALMAFTKALGRASPADGIRVVGVNPGSTATQRMEMLLRHRAQETLGDAARWMELCRDMPFGRPGKPEEIADAVAFLASPRSGYTTGTILTVAGG
ncbi:short-chain dehydrogenase/reductase [Limobrevibacterium gyesilva]|uniref:Short-chain dehydrogenase/reductase n=1 Tax=Limobrevibacterium gyesilva TaxID=2991712 RepID=A0AA42CJW5_9PROT|nr:short-chain dehydrogenase/reductase [Limobrevibacterium gyesilva]MCW3477260.1 short-chain dehydrogenase/reductase [Limobrevibacterium gyesilva]